MLSASSLIRPSIFMNRSPLLNTIAIQLFSLPKLLEQDLPGTMAMLSKMGYKAMELYGPYPFSSEAGKKRWEAVIPSVGFSGSGFFNRGIQEFKKIVSDQGIAIPSMHTDLDTLDKNMPQLAEAAHILGSEFVVLPALPDDKRKTLDDYKKAADLFNKIGAEAKKSGIKYAYHNHGYGLSPMEGKIPLNIILDNTDPKTVFLEMDLFWTTAGGADPISLLKKHSGRYKLMHIKDMSKKVKFSGDGGDAKQWIELWGYMTTAGNGVLDLKTILTTAKKNGVQHFIVEQDMVAEPEKALKLSHDYLAFL